MIHMTIRALQRLKRMPLDDWGHRACDGKEISAIRMVFGVLAAEALTDGGDPEVMPTCPTCCVMMDEALQGSHKIQPREERNPLTRVM